MKTGEVCAMVVNRQELMVENVSAWLTSTKSFKCEKKDINKIKQSELNMVLNTVFYDQ